MATAVAVLALSFITWFQSQRTPEVTMNLPSIVRIGSIGDGTFDVFLQRHRGQLDGLLLAARPLVVTVSRHPSPAVCVTAG